LRWRIDYYLRAVIRFRQTQFGSAKPKTWSGAM
jgi:hypothetical protein